jgi:signal transduction histidine kinase
MDVQHIILLADSNIQNCSQLKYDIEYALPYTVIESHSGFEALRIALEKKPDLILLDSMLSGINGYDLARQIKISPDIRTARILLMVPENERDKRLEAIESGADEIIMKPVEKTEMIFRVESLIRIKYFYDQLLLEREKIHKMKEEFLSLITHDLKTPLTSIIGNIQILLLNHQSEKDKNSLKTIDLASRNLLFLVNNLLNVMRIDSGNMPLAAENFLFKRLVEEVFSMMQPLAQKKKIVLKFSGENSIMVHGDFEKVRQVLINLISNAIKFSPEEESVEINAKEEEKGVVIQVIDQGSGISETDKQRLFQKFSQRKGEKGGTGLGLYIAKKMIDMHGSEIHVDSKPGQGAAFWFVLQKGKKK